MAAVVLPLHAAVSRSIHASSNWAACNGSPREDHFSLLTQIDPANVRRLKAAWIFNTGEVGGLETNPLIIDGVLYGYTPSLQVIALDAADGRLLWKFDSGVVGTQPSRGFSWWSDGRRHILFAGVMNYLYALDPDTGKPIPAFGENGRIDLRRDLRGDYTKNVAVLTSPGVIYQDSIIVGFRAPETKPAPPGDIRAYDVHTGALRWSFHTIPHPGEEGYNTWPKNAWKTAGAANNWTGMALDRKRGIVYVPTGSAVTDFYGYDRVGDDLFADTLLALDAKTGKKLWYFQTTHHDIWDRDPPSPPVLLTVLRNGKRVDAVAQTTKQGYVFVFDRVTGAPLFPVREEPFPQSTVPGEKTAPTQPIPQAPAPYSRQRLTADILTQRTAAAHAYAVQQFATFRSDGQFVPFSLDEQTVVFPGFDGGAEWGGAGADPRTGVLFVNANDVAWTGGLKQSTASGSAGSQLYQNQCALCHGTDRRGSPPNFPPLIGITERLTDTKIESIVHSGRGRMPSFPDLGGEQISELLKYLHSGAKPTHAGVGASPAGGEDPLGQKIYTTHCAICHGEDRMGAPSNYPGLIGVRQRLSEAQILNNVRYGKGRMPGFSDLNPQDDAALLRFLGPAPPASESSSKRELSSGIGSEAPYLFTGYRKFLDPDGYPAVAPPWGTLNAIDLNTGRYLWKVPLGDYPALAAQGLKNTGTENYGGPVITASGLLFIGATIFDHSLRAFDIRTGKVLWTGNLPYAGVATPATYMANGKQYVVIATSGQRDPNGPQGGAYIAFCLP
jgi:glucose dehydrogenase